MDGDQISNMAIRHGTFAFIPHLEATALKYIQFHCYFDKGQIDLKLFSSSML